MIQRTLFCIFTIIVLVSSQDGSNAINGNSSSISAIHSSLVIASSSKHIDPTSVQTNGTVLKNASSVVLSTNTIMLSSIHSVMPSSPVGPVSSGTAKTPILSSSDVALTSSAVPLVSSAASLVSSAVPIRSSSVMTTGVPLVSASPTAVPFSESIVLKNSNGTTCLMALLKAKFNIAYKQKHKNVTATATVPLDGNNLTYKGYCDEKIANFNLTWNEKRNKSNEHTFFMQFKNNRTTNNTFWIVQKLSAVFNTMDSAFTDAKNKSIMANGNGKSFGQVHDNTTYLCKAGLNVDMKPAVTIIFEKIVLQPFSDKKKLDTKGKHCSADNSGNDDDDDNTVPIAVGAALGGLVLIVLVAYIIGRRRSNRGYEQV